LYPNKERRVGKIIFITYFNAHRRNDSCDWE
jgi:hypothetical protein